MNIEQVKEALARIGNGGRSPQPGSDTAIDPDIIDVEGEEVTQ